MHRCNIGFRPHHFLSSKTLTRGAYKYFMRGGGISADDAQNWSLKSTLMHGSKPPASSVEMHRPPVHFALPVRHLTLTLDNCMPVRAQFWGGQST